MPTKLWHIKIEPGLGEPPIQVLMPMTGRPYLWFFLDELKQAIEQLEQTEKAPQRSFRHQPRLPTNAELRRRARRLRDA